MKVFILSFLFLLISLFAEVDLNYNYDYEKGGVKTKFSDWVPYKLHKWNPKFLEDYYELYGLKLHYGENELRRDIGFLKTGLNSNFRHPNNALCKVNNEKEYHKYRLLVTMHVNLQIMRSYMRIASQYDKRHVYFQNLDMAHDLKKSFKIAEGIYKDALPHWDKAEDLAKKADEIKREIDLGTMESERYEIVTGKLNFGNIIKDHLSRLAKKIETVEEYLKNHPDQDKPPL
jgi:hypothetical protein